MDLDAAWQLIAEFDAAGLGHHQAHQSMRLRRGRLLWRKATGGRLRRTRFPRSARVLAFNRVLDEETATEDAKTCIDAIAAPDYSAEAVRHPRAEEESAAAADEDRGAGELVVKSVTGGYLVQTADVHRLSRSETEVKTERAPTAEEWTALEFAWKVCKHVKSNAIVYARPRGSQTVSVGAGQMSRVDSVKIGAMKAVLPLQGNVVASDAFFPFPGRPGGSRQARDHGGDSAGRVGARMTR